MLIEQDSIGVGIGRDVVPDASLLWIGLQEKLDTGDGVHEVDTVRESPG